MTRRPILLAAALLLAGCAADEPDPAAQPAPDVTTFEQGRFDDLPQFPGSTPLGPPSEEDGVVARSFEVTGASPDQVLSYYRDTLPARWSMVTPVERLGSGTLRADWAADDHRLRVSATGAPSLENTDDAAGKKVVSQYSLSLRPL